MRFPLLAAAFLIAGSLLADSLAARAAPPADGPPNVLFLAVDDLKPVLGCYGDPAAKTPHIDRLATSGTVFANAACQWPVCGATRASLMTSLRPEAVGVIDLKTSMRAKNPDVLTLPQHFRNLGYTTAGTGKIYDPRCVDDKQTMDAPSWAIPFKGLEHSAIKFKDVDEYAADPVVADEDLTDGQIAENGLTLMNELARGDEPFFLAIGFKKPHLPFVAPKKYWDLYSERDFPPPAHGGGIINNSGYTLHDGPEFRGYGGVPETGPIPEAVRVRATHGYYACVSYIDALVGKVMARLEERGLAENTIVVLWGDHGFHLGDHGMWGKHSTLEQAARVPLIIRPVGGSAVRRTSTPVELGDMFPTLCALAGQPIPDQLQGRSLAPALDGSADAVRAGAVTVFKSRGSMGYSFRTQRYRYTEWINKRGKVVATELYDYDTDPLETKNLADDPATAPVRKALAAELRTHAEGLARLDENFGA